MPKKPKAQVMKTGLDENTRPKQESNTWPFNLEASRLTITLIFNMHICLFVCVYFTYQIIYNIKIEFITYIKILHIILYVVYILNTNKCNTIHLKYIFTI